MTFIKLKEEIKRIGLVTLYFLVCFWIIVLLRSLFLSEFGLHVYGYSAAAFGALVVAKVILLLDATSFGRRFEEFSRSLHISYLSMVYTFWVFIVVLIEHFVRFARSGTGFEAAFAGEVAQIGLQVVLAKTICVFIAFVIFFSLRELNKSLAPEGLRGFFLASGMSNK